MGWLLSLLPLVPPIMPLVRWPVAARMVPKLQELGQDLYIGAWGIGVADGFGWGLTLGIPIGAITTVAIASMLYWAFFRPVTTESKR